MISPYLRRFIKTSTTSADSTDFSECDISNIDEILKSGTLIKDDKSTRIIYIHKPKFKEAAIVKKFKFKGWLHSILRSLRESRASTYWKGAIALTEAGIITPKPLAFIEKKLGPITTESYIITEFYSGQNAKIVTDQAGYFPRKTIEEFVDKAINILSTMFNNRITHGDTKLPNFMIKGSEVCIIDLDVMRVHTSKNNLKKHIKQDIDRFERDWEEHPYKDIVIPKIKQLRNSFVEDQQ